MKKLLLVLCLLLSACVQYPYNRREIYIQDIPRQYYNTTVTFVQIGRPFYADSSDIVMTYDKWVSIHEFARKTHSIPSIPKNTNIIVINVPDNNPRYMYKD